MVGWDGRCILLSSDWSGVSVSERGCEDDEEEGRSEERERGMKV